MPRRSRKHDRWALRRSCRNGLASVSAFGCAEWCRGSAFGPLPTASRRGLRSPDLSVTMRRACEVEGAHASAFLSELVTAAPPLARIDSIEVAAIAPVAGEGFIIEATRQGKSTTRIGADAAVCEDCLDELFDP